jgi:FliI/YscN family ATPase
MNLPEWQQVLELGRDVPRREQVGKITGLSGITLEAVGLEAALGELCMISAKACTVPAEIVGFSRGHAVLMPIGNAFGVAPGDPVRQTGQPLSIRVGDDCLGRVLDGLGRPLDGGPTPRGKEMNVQRDPPPPMERQAIVTPLETGISAIDGFLTNGLGQRIGIFAGSGVGKSTLMGMIARGASSDVNVIALVGERGREVKDFVEGVLGPEGMAKSVLVVATSDASPLLRYKATFSAVTIAEHFRDQGKHVLFMMDSVTRFAAASREIGLAAGEPPTLRGYPPSFFATLPRVVERLGTAGRGSITGMLTVLVEGDDLNEPVSDTVRGLLDGHIILDRKIAARGNFPAIDILGSVSRLMDRIVPPEAVGRARILRKALSIFEENRDLIQVGAWKRGADPELDLAIDLMPGIQELLYQDSEDRSLEETQKLMERLTSGLGSS